MAMSSRQGRQPQRSARSPGRSASPRKAALEPSLEREQALQKQLGELQKYKELEEKEKKKEEALKKKELLAAKKRLSKEVQTSMKAVKKYEQDVVKLQTQIRKLQGQESDVKKKTAETETKFKEKLHVTEVKHQDMESKLSQTYSDFAQEKSKLQQLQLQLDVLNNTNRDLSKPGQLPPGGAIGALRDAGEGRGLAVLHDSGVETTDAEGEERFAQAESEVYRLTQEIDAMRTQFEAAEEQKQTLLERLAEAERGELGSGQVAEDIHRECREAIEALRRELDKLREENEGLHEKLGNANKALELQEECIEELAGRASGVGEGLMNIASQELARCSVLQSESRNLSGDVSRRDSVDVSGGTLAAEESAAQRQAEDAVCVGDFVRLSGDSSLVREAFRSMGFAWTEQTDAMLGKSFQVVEVPKPGVVGVPSPDGSQGGVWYLPIGVLQKAASQPGTPGSASATASTAATFHRGLYPRGAQPTPVSSTSANSFGIQASHGRPSTPGRLSGFQGGGSGRPLVALSGSSGTMLGTTYPGQTPASSTSVPPPGPQSTPSPCAASSVGRQTPASPPSFGGLAGSSTGLEGTSQPASQTSVGVAGTMAPGSSSASSVSVIVSSIPFDLSDDHIIAEFARYGVIIEMRVQRDDSGPQNSYALLTFSSREEAARAVEAANGGKIFLPGATVPCEVGFARGAQVASPRSARAQQQGGAQPTQVIVRHIPSELPDDFLMGEFAKFGVISGFQVQRDPAGPEKSYAIMTYQSRDEAARAVEATGNGRFVLPGASVPCEVGLMRLGQVATGQPATARQQSGTLQQQQQQPHQVIVHSVPTETADDLLLAEFSKFGTVVDFKVHRESSGAPKSYAVMTYQTREEAMRAVEVTNGRLIMPGATAPAQVGFLQMSPLASAQVHTARQPPGSVPQQARPQSAPRLRSGPGLISGSPSGAAVVVTNADVRRQISGLSTTPGAEAAEGGFAWAAADARQPAHDLNVSAGALHSSRQKAVQRQRQMGLPSEPIAGMAAGGSDIRQLSPSGQRYLAGPPGCAPILAAGSTSAGGYLEAVHGQGGRVIAYRSPARSPMRSAGVAAPGTASPGVMMPTPGAAWRGGATMPMSARLGRQQAPVAKQELYLPSAAGAQSPVTAALGVVLTPAPAGAVASAETIDNLSCSMNRSTGAHLRDAVAKVTAKALREYRQNHRNSLAMDLP
uniref:RRM domain-containing protein n=1 Tax=Alexandrium monilatum TaxID=311494 RepID=A0A7S4R0F8_9DINO